MELGFEITRVKGLRVQVINTSTDIPMEYTLHWGFGDGTEYIGNSPAIHTYSSLGEYEVTLSIKNEDLEEVSSVTQNFKLLTKTFSKEALLDISKNYIPEELLPNFEQRSENLREKHLIYLQPLVNHEVPEDEYDVEENYEMLEVQLAAELVAHDFLISEITKHLTGAIAGTGGNGEDDGDGEVKKITTGPTDAEFYSETESTAKIVKALENINKPGGIMDGLKISICQLAHRLEIYLPMCGRPTRPNKTFKIAKRDENWK